MATRGLASTKQFAALCFAPLLLVVVGACDSSDGASSDTVTQTTAADPDAIVSACRAAAEALGFEVIDAFEPISVDFKGLILSTGSFVQLGRDEGLVVQGNAAVLQQAHEYCGLGAAPGNCIDVPLIAVTAGGAWAVVDQPLPAEPPGVPTVPPPTNDPECPND